jgi:hypothetical protein
MKLTRTYYFQWGLGNTPDALVPGFNAPSGRYLNPLTIDKKASIYINIPFKVKKIHIKNITYKSGANSGQGNATVQNYVTFQSSLVGNAPVGMVFRDSLYSMATIQDIEHVFQLPEVIQGYFDFTTYFGDGSEATPYLLSVNLGNPNPYEYLFDSFSITMEFNDENEIF